MTNGRYFKSSDGGDRRAILVEWKKKKLGCREYLVMKCLKYSISELPEYTSIGEKTF